MIKKFDRRRYNFHIWLARIFRLLLVAIIANIFTQNWLNLFTSILTLILTYLPFFIAERNHFYIPAPFQIIILLFIFASLYLGELQQYYHKFWWWDIMLHTLSGVILGFVGFLLVFLLNKEKQVNVVLSPLFIAIFSFTFAVTVGVIWEIFEFTMDSIFALNMQKSGLVDTMWDLIVDSIGAFLVSLFGYFYSKNNSTSYFKNILEQFKYEDNYLKR